MSSYRLNARVGIPARPVRNRRRSAVSSPNAEQARSWAVLVQRAVDELYANPFDRNLRARVIHLLVHEAPQADLVMRRAIAELPPPTIAATG